MNINPYIIGRPIHEKNNFYGRETLFASIEDNLNNGTQIILLHGQRRIGKSSVLKQIPNFIQQQEFIFVQFDLQHHKNNSLAKILEELSQAIVEQTDIINTQIIPTSNDLEANPWSAFSRRFLPKLYQEINHQNLVLLIDEFDVIGNHSHNESHQSHFYSYIQKLLSDESQLFLIPVIGRYPNELPRLRTLFRAAPFQEIGLLDEIGTSNLVIKPAEGILTYKNETIEEILKLSAGHPFFTQAICSALFAQARNNNNWIVYPSDVKPILNQAIGNAESGLNGNWDILTIPERVIVSAIAEVTVKEPGFEKYSEEQLFTLLNNNGVVKTEYLSEAVDKVSKNVCCYDRGFNIISKLNLFWLLQNHKLKDEIKELNTIGKENIDRLKEVADNLRKKGAEVIHFYEHALEINPNNFEIVSILAKEYLQKNEFTKACELAKRLYQADPLHNKEEYLDVLSVYGHHLISNREFSLAKQQYLAILEIEPNRISAAERLGEIDVYKQKFNGSIPNLPPNILKLIRGSRFSLILPIVTILGLGVLGVGHNQFFPCAQGQRKELLFFCQPDRTRISNGDRTFFPTINNPSRDQGIQAFKQGKYQDAAKLFKKAVTDNPNKKPDPEVLIYYNNVRARQSGNPFSLAVVVPADNNDKNKLDVAKEMLRGVAQSQNQFNKKGGLNDRLLEIVIANDAGEPEQAKKVAAELIKNKSILGIIGHHSSESTKAALKEYNKTDIAVISPTSTSIFLEGNNFFRGLPSDTTSAETLAVHVFEKLNIRKIAIYYNDSPFSNSMREEFTKKFENLGGEIVRRILIDGTQLDRDKAQKIVARSVFRYKAEAALLCPDARHINNALKIAQANKELLDRTSNRRGFKQLLGCDTLYGSDIVSKGGDAIEGLITVVPWFRETPEASNFAQKAESEWGGGVSWRTAISFDTTQAFLQALSRNPTRSTVITKLKNVTVSANATSGYVFKFNPEKERETEPNLVYVKNNKFVSIL